MQLFSGRSAAISIANASLSENDNTTAFSVQLTNEGNTTETIYSVIVAEAGVPGNSTFNYNSLTDMTAPLSTAPFTSGLGQEGHIRSPPGNLSAPPGPVSPLFGFGYRYNVRGPGARLPTPPNNTTAWNYNSSAGYGPFFYHGAAMPMPSFVAAFMANANGTLSLPQMQGRPQRQQLGFGIAPGFALSPYSTVTLSYTGELMGFGGNPLPVSDNSTYSITIVTNDGMAQTNVTFK
jgi:hypothetical protein